MTPEIVSVPRPEWSPLPYEGCRNVQGKVLVDGEELLLALLRFEPEGTIHEHPGPTDTVVICLEGSGFTSVAGETAPLHAGQRVRWPAGITHRLWTEHSTMTTLMVERPLRR